MQFVRLSVRLFVRPFVRRSLVITALALAAAAPLEAQSGEPTAAAFHADLDAIQRLMENQAWDRALSKLDALLAAHDGRAWARSRKVDIVEIHRRCSFGATQGRLDPKKLVSGTLMTHNLRSGRIKVRYADGRRGDDFEKQDSMLIHKASFDGPHKITISGPATHGVRTLLLCLSPSPRYYAVSVHIAEGGGAARLVSYDGRKRIDSRDAEFTKVGSKLKIEIRVAKSKITLRVANRTIESIEKERGEYGAVGFARTSGSDTITLEGTAPSWLTSVIGAKREAALKTFKEGYDPKKALPAWLFEAAKHSIDDAKIHGGLPGADGFDDVERKRLEEVGTLIAKGARADAMRALRRMVGSDEAPGAALMLLARLYVENDRPEGAQKLAERAKKLHPDHPGIRTVEARAQFELGDVEAAMKTVEAVLASHPIGDAHALAAYIHLHEGRIAEAHESAKAALAIAHSPDLEQLYRIVVKAKNGPPWPKRFEYESTNYHVMSDIDRKTCARAAAVLEAAYAIYNVRLKSVGRGEKRRFPVYLFSDEASYLAYTKDISGVSPQGSAGLYSPVLKHLLIWNLPARDAMMRTVRHEGFHQYLDRLMDQPPSWLNEGLAEYYETAEIVSGRRRMGMVREDHLYSLKKKLVPLKDFLYQPPSTFYAKPGLHYAQAWAFVHFLRHTTRERRDRFETLFDALLEPGPWKPKVRKQFPDAELAELESAFHDYLAGLR